MAWSFVVTFALLLAAPTLVAYYPPMSDLAYHEGTVSLFAHLRDPAFAPPGLYRANLGHPNQLFHLVAAALTLVLGSRWAVKLVVACAQVLVVLGAARLARCMGREAWLGLLAAPISLGWFYYWGLATNIVGLAAFFFALPTLLATGRRPTAAGLTSTFGWFVTLFFAHETPFAMAWAAFAGLSLLAAPSLKHLARALLLCIASAALAAAHLYYAETLFAAAVVRPPPDHLTLGHRAARVVDALVGTQTDEVWWVFAALFAATLSLLALPRIARASRASLIFAGLAALLVVLLLGGSFLTTRFAQSPDETVFVRNLSWGAALLLSGLVARRLLFDRRHGAVLASLLSARRRLARRPLLAVGLMLLTAFVVVPFNWNGASLLYGRFFAPAFVLLGTWLAPRRLSRASRLALSAIPCALVVVGAPQFVEADRGARELAPLLSKVPRSGATALVEFDLFGGRGRTFAPQTVAARVLAERGGRISTQFTDSPISLVLMRPESQWTRATKRLRTKGSDLRLPHDVELFGHMLVHAQDPAVQFLIGRALAPYARLVDTSGEWMLFASRHEVVAVDAPEPPPGTPASTPLADLISRYVADQSEHLPPLR